jgi:ribosomal-protein-alanine N-acetyltransferase
MIGRVELTTARLRLRPFGPADLDAAHAVYADPEVMRWVGHGAHRMPAETRSALRGYADALAKRGYGFVAVVERASGDLIGDAGLHPLGGRGPDIELGYTLARSAWGRGYGTEIARALAEHAFDALGAERVFAQVEPANRASRHVLEKLGMTERATRMAHGRPHLLYAVERDDYMPGERSPEERGAPERKPVAAWSRSRDQSPLMSPRERTP